MSDMPHEVEQQILRARDWQLTDGRQSVAAEILRDLLQAVEDTLGFAAPIHKKKE